MGLHRFFSVYADYRSGEEIKDQQLAEKIKNEFDKRYSGWSGMLIDGDPITQDDCNWYDWDTDTAEIANLFPDIVFTVCCAGETIDDTFNAGFCRGRRDIQCADIPPIDYAFLRGEKPK